MRQWGQGPCYHPATQITDDIRVLHMPTGKGELYYKTPFLEQNTQHRVRHIKMKKQWEDQEAAVQTSSTVTPSCNAGGWNPLMEYAVMPSVASSPEETQACEMAPHNWYLLLSPDRLQGHAFTAASTCCLFLFSIRDFDIGFLKNYSVEVHHGISACSLRTPDIHCPRRLYSSSQLVNKN